jgi:glycerol-1-phosphate dehydrogenase [NAD(P)+]
VFTPALLALLKPKLPALPRLVMETSLGRDIDDLASEAFKGRFGVVDDGDTGRALGDKVFQALAKHDGKHITLPGTPAATDENVEFVREQSRQCDALVAVGGGTISDICKYASALDKKPYVVFPTAASMNGYLSANASITIKGYKKTVPGQMPLAVFCDLGVIAAAPVRLSKSGLGDSIARPTAQADWLLSHLLLGTAYDETPFTLLKDYEPQLFDSARGVGKGDPETIKLLMQVLLLSGLGMTVAGGSYPASQAEHMIAHAYNMHVAHASGGRISQKTLHGEEVAVTALAMIYRQETLLRMTPIFADPVFPEARIVELFGAHVASEAKNTYAQKVGLIYSSPACGGGSETWASHRYVPSRAVGEAMSPPPLTSPPLAGGIKDWPAIAAKIESIMVPSPKMQSILDAANCKTTSELLGWKQDAYFAASGAARFLRERFTFLDLV